MGTVSRLNIYFINMFVFQVMEEIHQRNRISMAHCRALQQDLQTVSLPHHTAPLVVSYHSFVAPWPHCLSRNLHQNYVWKIIVFFPLRLSPQQTPSRLSCAATMSHQMLHSLRTERLWGTIAGGMTEETPWKKGMQSLLELAEIE